AKVMAAAGADVIEIGLPYSDPLMDGPVIAEAVQRALAAGTRVADVLRTVEAVAASGVAVLVMTYWNPVDRYGVPAFARDLAAAGGSGLIAQVTRACRGFVYAASLMGITGTRDAVSSDAPGLVARTREHTDLPVAVGLGVSNGAQAAQVAAFADGVIVGSAFVRRLLEADGGAATGAIADLTTELREGVSRKTR